MLFNLDKKTKIVATLGPASATYEKILSLFKEGMNVARLNFSHGDYASHQALIDLVRKIEKDKGVIIPIMLDTKGPEIRIHEMKDGAQLIKDRSVFRIAMRKVLGTSERISVTYRRLFDDVKVKDRIAFDDGALLATVIGKDEEKKELIVRANNSHLLKSGKGVNVPFVKLRLPFLSKKDEEDLAFGCRNDVDYVAASFIRSARDVGAIRKILAASGKPGLPVIAKIENAAGIEHLDAIIKAADGIMVARGDLGVEVAEEDVPLLQRKMILACRALGKPVITATQMLDSMQTHPRPTRAEVSDVANAVLESSDAVMLSAETASGLYPLESVRMQAKICAKTERYLNYEAMADEAYQTSEKTVNDAIADAIATSALLIGAKLIISFTTRGTSAKRIAKARPVCPIIAVTRNRKTAESLGVYWGIYPVLINEELPETIDELQSMAVKIAADFKVRPGAEIILAGGLPAGRGKTDLMKIITVP